MPNQQNGSPIPASPDTQVLSTLNTDGSRRWMRPKLSKGSLLNARRVVAYFLILLFAAIPLIKFRGLPLVLLDLPKREFTLFGTTFLPTDTLLVALLVLTLFVSIFLVTAVLGRVWCGWACPQTVYMEFLYRPIERLFEGKHYRTKGKAEINPFRIVAKYIVYFVISLFLANTFLAYFVGWDTLITWTVGSPANHLPGFMIVMGTTALMMLDFSILREQVCTLMCPYGRFQSVLLDPQSLIVSYDPKRGEPRGHAKRPKNNEPAPQTGDCIDCDLCVTTCPTGIDIRKGLQMECIACTQCIDACNAVMDKIKKPRGLIRFSSQQAIETGNTSFFRPRIIIYPFILLILITALTSTLLLRKSADVTFLRNRTTPYTVLDTGEISTTVILKIINKDRIPHTYNVTVIEESQVTSNDLPMTIQSGGSAIITLKVIVPQTAFTGGRSILTTLVTDDADFSNEYSLSILGPLFGSTQTPPDIADQSKQIPPEGDDQ